MELFKDLLLFLAFALTLELSLAVIVGYFLRADRGAFDRLTDARGDLRQLRTGQRIVARGESVPG